MKKNQHAKLSRADIETHNAQAAEWDFPQIPLPPAKTPKSKSGLLKTLKQAERVVYLDRINAAFHAYNTPAESLKIADKDKLVVALRAAIKTLST